MRGRDREREGRKAERKGRGGQREKGTYGSSHHVVYQRHFILIFRERGGGKGLEWWRREKA